MQFWRSYPIDPDVPGARVRSENRGTCLLNSDIRCLLWSHLMQQTGYVQEAVYRSRGFPVAGIRPPPSPAGSTVGCGRKEGCS
jgi:hypothetical protein